MIKNRPINTNFKITTIVSLKRLCSPFPGQIKGFQRKSWNKQSKEEKTPNSLFKQL